MVRKINTTLLFLLLSFGSLYVQEIPDCMCTPHYWVEDGEDLYNNNNRVLDTCGIKHYSSNCDSIFWLNYDSYNYINSRLYAIYYWYIIFKVDAIPIPAVPQDTTIWVIWQAIDT